MDWARPCVEHLMCISRLLLTEILRDGQHGYDHLTDE